MIAKLLKRAQFNNNLTPRANFQVYGASALSDTSESRANTQSRKKENKSSYTFHLRCIQGPSWQKKALDTHTQFLKHSHSISVPVTLSTDGDGQMPCVMWKWSIDRQSNLGLQNDPFWNVKAEKRGRLVHPRRSAPIFNGFQIASFAGKKPVATSKLTNQRGGPDRVGESRMHCKHWQLLSRIAWMLLWIMLCATSTSTQAFACGHVSTSFLTVRGRSGLVLGKTKQSFTFIANTNSEFDLP